MEANIQIIANLAIILTPFLTVLLGIYLWKRQYKGESTHRFALAFSELLVDYEVCFNEVRNEQLYFDEVKTEVIPKDYSKEAIEIINGRLKQLDAVDAKIFHQKYIAKSFFGGHFAKQMEKLKSSTKEYEQACSDYVRYSMSLKHPKIINNDIADIDEVKKIIFKAKEDVFGNRVEREISQLHHSLRQYIEFDYNSGSNRLFRWLTSEGKDNRE